MLLSFPDILVIIGALTLTIYLGLRNSHNTSKDSDVNDYILATNKIGYIATGASLAASYSSAFGMIGLPVQTMISGTVMYGGTMISMFLAIFK